LLDVRHAIVGAVAWAVAFGDCSKFFGLGLGASCICTLVYTRGFIFDSDVHAAAVGAFVFGF